MASLESIVSFTDACPEAPFIPPSLRVSSCILQGSHSVVVVFPSANFVR